MAIGVLRGGVFLALTTLFMLGLASCESGEGTTTADSLRGGETRPTLDPARFTGLSAEAYQAARDIPEIIDSLYCYCDCERHFGHKSLLTCFVDEHAVYCDICIYEALMARDLHRQGMDTAAIRKAVDEKFSRLRHNGSH
ncbi:MAG: hypothetical protein H3C68_02150 [Deltaproteobacteria bacterium]|nr:hypothetical protein [Deltaproteobacteria bacterium]MBZ0218942.1 PCYCGC domain-containing protein [Deltaproteobacteria bacterium]